MTVDLNKLVEAPKIRALDQKALSAVLMKAFADEFDRQMGGGTAFLKASEVTLTAAVFAASCVRLAAVGVHDASPAEDPDTYMLRVMRLRDDTVLKLNLWLNEFALRALSQEFKL